jgi:hypothetical protein
VFYAECHYAECHYAEFRSAISDPKKLSQMKKKLEANEVQAELEPIKLIWGASAAKLGRFVE